MNRIPPKKERLRKRLFLIQLALLSLGIFTLAFFAWKTPSVQEFVHFKF